MNAICQNEKSRQELVSLLIRLHEQQRLALRRPGKAIYATYINSCRDTIVELERKLDNMLASVSYNYIASKNGFWFYSGRCLVHIARRWFFKGYNVKFYQGDEEEMQAKLIELARP